MSTITILRNGISKLLDLSGFLAGCLITVIGFIVAWGVIARYFLIPAHWVEPYSIYLFIAASFLGAAYAMKKGEHVRVDLLLRALSARLRKVVETLTTLAALTFFIYLTWRSTVMVQHTYFSGTTDLSLLEINLWIPQLFLALGAFLMCLSLIWHLFNIFLSEEEAIKTDKV